MPARSHFTSTDGQAVLPANSTLTLGTGTFSGTLKTAGTQTITRDRHGLELDHRHDRHDHGLGVDRDQAQVHPAAD